MEKLFVNEYIAPSDCAYLAIISNKEGSFYDCDNELARQEEGRPNCRECGLYKSISAHNKEIEHKKELDKLKNNLLELEITRLGNKNCNLETCRYNHNGICQNEEKRKECVEVSKLVLCLEDNETNGFSEIEKET